MRLLRYLRDAAVFAPCYLVLDWASYIDPLGPFNITPWNPQPALAIVWMMLGGLVHAPAVLATVVLADIVIRHAPGGLQVTLLSSLVLTTGYAGMAWTLQHFLKSTSLASTRQLTVFAGTVVAGTGIIGAAFIGLLHALGLLADTPFGSAWLQFWIGDAVGILVTAPLLFAVADADRRTALVGLARRPEVLLQIAVLAATVGLIFSVFGADPSRHFYLLFLPLIWIAVRFGMNGAIAAVAIVQLGVVLGIHKESGMPLPVLELRALMVALTLTGLFLGVMVDQRQRAEEGLRQTLRLAAAAEMAGAIAHEVNQPLTAVANYGRAAQILLARERGSPAEVEAIIRRMLAEAERAADVVRRLRDFFRAGTMRLEPVEVGELLAAAQRMGDAAIDGRPIALEIGTPPHVGALLVDRLQIEVILRNLVANSVESLAASGRRDARIQVQAEPRGEDQVRIVVADNGPGISAAARERLFAPFNSAKPTGMGLGLAVSRAIAEAHGGTLEAPTLGSTEFHLVLPCAQGS